MSRRCAFIVAGEPGQRTGGYRYDARLVEGLRTAGWQVRVHGLRGRFPVPDADAWRALEETLSNLSDGERVVIDGLALGGFPDLIGQHARRLRIIALIHHPLADESGIDPIQRAIFLRSEADALAFAVAVVTTSKFTARRLNDFGVASERVTVVEPGVEPAPVAAADGHPMRLLCVATITPRKGHDVLVEALKQLDGLGWQCDCIGSLARDPEHASRVRLMIESANLSQRVRLLGELDETALAAAYAQADCMVLASHYEGYGMVVDEAIARGLPVVCTRGGALVDTVPEGAGLLVGVERADELAQALRSLIEQPELRWRLRDGARKVREQLQSWSSAVDRFGRVLDTV